MTLLADRPRIAGLREGMDSGLVVGVYEEGGNLQEVIEMVNCTVDCLELHVEGAVHHLYRLEFPAEES